MARGAMVSGGSAAGGGLLGKAVFWLVALAVAAMVLREPVQAGEFVRSAWLWTQDALYSVSEFVRAAMPQ